MTYVPITYYSFHLPFFVASWLIIALFATFIAMMYLAFKYEVYNKQNICDPMFYYGKPCNNMMANMMLNNSDFVYSKQNFYQSLDKYDPQTGQFTGAKKTIQDAEQTINDSSEPAIQKIMQKNEDFIKNNNAEISNMTSLLQLLSLKYLGNVEENIEHAKDLPPSVQSQLKDIPNELQNLRDLVKESLVDPLYTRYSAPLKKLYNYLTDVKVSGT